MRTLTVFGKLPIPVAGVGIAPVHEVAIAVQKRVWKTLHASGLARADDKINCCTAK
jgi:hypothetical protein